MGGLELQRLGGAPARDQALPLLSFIATAPPAWRTASPAAEDTMSTLARALTVDDVRAMPHLGERCELIDGELFVAPVPVARHQRLVVEFLVAIDRILRPRGQHRLVFPGPYDVRLSPYRVVQPDLVYVDQARAAIITDDFIDGAPDLVVEILSPSTRNRDLILKRRLYAEAGVREYWIVDPAARTITMLVLAGGLMAEVPGDVGRFRSHVLPELVIDQGALFAGL